MHKKDIKKILIINLSNIGDVILTLPSIDLIKGNFPDTKLTMLVGPKASSLFDKDSRISELIIYDKHKPFKDKIALTFALRKKRFDMVLDFRHTVFPLFLKARYKSRIFFRDNGRSLHRKDLYLNLTLDMYPFDTRYKLLPHIALSVRDEEYINRQLQQRRISDRKKVIVVAPGAASHNKRWTQDGFAAVCNKLTDKSSALIVFVGDKNDIGYAQGIIKKIDRDILDLTGKTTLKQLAFLLNKSDLLISNDSAVMHMGSYLDIPVLAIFGHTDPKKYAPWNNKSRLVRKEINRYPYVLALNQSGQDYMAQLSADIVCNKAKEMLLASNSDTDIDYRYKRILISRIDRIGDVVLSTPAFKAVRDYYPNAYIAVMVRPYALDIVDGNPHIDEVILYDKDAGHKSFLNTIRFARNLKKGKFDLAIVLHPTNRSNLIPFIAGIPQRVGFDRKLGFLLTKRIEHTKQLGEKHEVEYTLDVLRSVGIDSKENTLFMPLKKESEIYIDEQLKKSRISDSDRLIALHPGASCPSKKWPAARFAEVADKLIEKYRAKIILVSGQDDAKIVDGVMKAMHHTAISFAGKTTLSQLASLLKRCKLFISNDSGPVHISSAVGTAVISIFGRNQAGLSPRRWGPTGKSDKIVHKEVGCQECLAHNCQKEFLCLKSISANEIMELVDVLSKVW